MNPPEKRSAAWDVGDVNDGPWYVARESREDNRLAVKSGWFTIFTVGDYFDGGGPLEERLATLCELVNTNLGNGETGAKPGDGTTRAQTATSGPSSTTDSPYAASKVDLVTRIAEIRQENRGGDVSYRDIDWLCDLVMIELRPAIKRLTQERDQAVAALEQIEDTLYKARYPHA